MKESNEKVYSSNLFVQVNGRSLTECGEIECGEAALQFGRLAVRVHVLSSKQSLFEGSQLHFG